MRGCGSIRQLAFFFRFPHLMQQTVPEEGTVFVYYFSFSAYNIVILKEWTK